MRNLKKHILIIIVLFCTFNILKAQSSKTPYSKKEYLYIKHDSSYLENFEAKTNLLALFAKLDKLYFEGEGQISILHFGGSHIQAGIWSYELRRNFERIIPEIQGAPGIVFPFSMAKTNHPFYYRSSYKGKWEISKITDLNPKDTIGITGVTAKTEDSISNIKIFFTPVADIENRRFDKISIFHNIDDTTYKINLIPENVIDSVLVNSGTRATEFYLNKPIDTLDLQIIKTDTIKSSFYFYGALLENSKPSIKYTGIGINGASTSSYLKAEYLDYHLKAINPDLVIFSIGVNDAASKSFSKQVYISNYKKLADKILEVNPYCAIIFTTNNDFYYYRGGVNPHYKAVYYAMTSLAKKYNASVWNMFNVMGGYKSINFWKNDKIARRDRIHFTRAGYKILADLLFDAIMKDYEEFLIKK